MTAAPAAVVREPGAPRAEVLAAVPMCLAGAVWGLLYVVAGVPSAAAWPWAYTVLAVLNLLAYRRLGWHWALDVQLALSLVIPWLLMLDLGGFAASGAVGLWSLLAPLAALLTSGFRRAAWWFAAYAVLIVVAALTEPGTPPEAGLSDAWVAAMFALNVLGVTAVAWLVTGRYATGYAALMTREREARDEAESATRAKSDFLANMSHEIRTPMNAVIGMSTLLDGTELDAEQREYLSSIRNSSELLLAVINDVLDFSKIEAGRLQLESARVDVRDVVESALDVAAPLASARGLDLASLVEPAVPRHVLGDAARLRQVLVNLLTNAVKFTEQGEVVLTVAAEEDDGTSTRVRFAVRDTGIGIPAEARERLFQSFSQADTSVTRRFGGTGLGLAISQRIVTLMGGSIGVDSAPGRGSTFAFTVPLTALPPEPGAAADPDIGVLAGRRAVVADHNDAHRAQLRALAQEWDVSVADAADVAALADAVEVPGTEVVLVDLDLPGDVEALLRGLRERRPRPAVVLVVPLGRRDAVPPSVAAAVDAVVTRPVKQSSLHDALVDVLSDRPQRHRARPRPVELDPGLAARAPLRILVAEDNATNQRLATRLLERLGYTADVVDDGAQAVDAVRTVGYDLVLMDVQMPVMDGLEAAQRIRALPELEGRRPQVVAVTANSTAADRAECSQAGMDGFLIKPIRPAELAAAIEQAYARGRSALAAPPAERDDGAATSAVDLDALRRLTELTGDTEFVRSLLAEFAGEAGTLLQRLRDAAPGDLPAVRLHAHSLKSSAANVGLTDLSQRAAALERAALAADGDAVAAGLPDLERAAATGLAALERTRDW